MPHLLGQSEWTRALRSAFGNIRMVSRAPPRSYGCRVDAPARASRSAAPSAASSALRATATSLSRGSVRGYRFDLIGTNLHDRHHLEKDAFYESRVNQYVKPMKESKTVTVTGPAGQIGYSLLFRLAR